MAKTTPPAVTPQSADRVAAPASVARRSDWLLRGAVLATALVLLGLLAWQLRPVPRAIVGGALVSGTPPTAANFQLTDQLGQPTSVQQFLGKPVALTFIYTRCPDVCPLISANLHQTYRQLGSDASKVALLAVTVDPENDSVDQIKTYSDKIGLTNEWHFMTGRRAALESVWKAYGILARPVDANGTPVAAAQQGASGLAQTPDAVEHAAPLFLIDKKGAVRAMLPVDFTTETLLTDLRVLLAES